jgi:phosphoglycolate phosphatase-like HAD superfamily hydrolase
MVCTAAGDVGRPLLVLDIDGVLADVRHRLRHVQAAPKDWDAFFAAARDDPPLTEGVRLAREGAVDCEVVYVTGRPERCRADTLAWLDEHGLPAGRLAMRADGDRRPARVAKLGLLRRLARERPVAAVVDDDPQVCAAYAAAGFPVLRAQWMAPQPVALQQAQEQDGRT